MLGVLVGFVGAGMLILKQHEGDALFPEKGVMVYSLLVVLATLCYGLSSNLMKVYFDRNRVQSVTALALAAAAVVYLPWLLFFSEVPTKLIAGGSQMWASLGAIALLSVVGTALALALYQRLVQLTDPVFSTMVTYLMPIVVLVWGLYDQEHIAWIHMLGTLVILGGVYLVNKKD